VDIDNPPEAYFEAMRRLRPEPPDEETVERILEIFREYWRKQDSEAGGELEGPGGRPHRQGTLEGRASKFRTYLAGQRPLVGSTSASLSFVMICSTLKRFLATSNPFLESGRNVKS
jgi:hypothetical protein